MKLKLYLNFLLISFLFTVNIQSQDRPKLIVGIVVDQMRYDYLYRFMPYYGNDGFKRLLAEGTNFSFAHFNYSLTSTGPGHSTIYTGTTPFYHGIIGNDWYDKNQKKTVNCVEDLTVASIGSHDKEGMVSPRKLLATTITDELKLATYGTAKVISVSLKDRAAILPGGHMPNGAYWYDGETGNFITSSYYMNALPNWVGNFNKRKLADKYLTESWNLSLPDSDYMINAPDNASDEKDIFDEGKTSFPHKFDKLNSDSKYGALENTPFCNTIVKECAKAALINEDLGKDSVTDFLAVSFSSTDKVQHAYGSNSFETEDTYIKLDSTIADFLKSLDKQVGKGNYLLFLTADHAGSITPEFLKEHNLPTGGLNTGSSFDSLRKFVEKKFGDKNIIENISNRQIFLNRKVIEEKNLNIHELELSISDFLRDTFPAITTICTRDFLEGRTASRVPQNMILNVFNPTLSGDIIFDLQPGYLPNFETKGTNHGSPYTYDTHVPLIFYGWHIMKERINTPVYTVDIAPTIADLIHITEPSACIGIPLLK